MRLKVISNQRWDVFPDTMYIVGDRAFSVVAARTWNGLIPRHDTSAISISVVDDAECIVVTRVCVSVCVSVHGRMPTVLHGPGCNFWGVVEAVP